MFLQMDSECSDQTFRLGCVPVVLMLFKMYTVLQFSFMIDCLFYTTNDIKGLLSKRYSRVLLRLAYFVLL